MISLLSKFRGFYLEHKGFFVSLLLMTTVFLVAHNIMLHRRVSSMANDITKERNRFSTWTDKLGRDNALLKQTNLSLQTLNAEEKKTVATEARNLGVKPKNIKEVTNIASETKGNFSAKEDTNHNVSVNDGHLKLDTHRQGDSVKGEYVYTDTATYIRYTKARKFLFITYGHDTYIDFHFNNKNTHITGLTDIYIDPYKAPKRLGLGLNVSAVYIDGKIQPMIGAGLQYNIINIR